MGRLSGYGKHKIVMSVSSQLIASGYADQVTLDAETAVLQQKGSEARQLV